MPTRLHPRRSWWPTALLALLGLGFASSSSAADNPRIYTQAPEVAESEVRGEPTPEPAKPAANEALKGGPVPSWIWAPNGQDRAFLKTTFEGGSKEARLKASCDNHAVIYLNGKRVATADDWQAPVEADVQRLIQPGRNELLADVRNDGGQAGFILKLALTDSNGTTRHVVTDAKNWKALDRRDAEDGETPKVVGTLGDAPWGDVFSQESLAGGRRGIFELRPGFKVERLFVVPKDELGSWVSITFDPKGRLIVSDQGKNGLCRVTPPPIGSKAETKVERLKGSLTGAHGMLYAFNSLYLTINESSSPGLYRARDTDGDDQFDEVVKLKAIRGGGEHGPHGLRLSPDGKSIVMVAGNHTLPPENFQASRLPSNWGEDQLLPRQWDANGHARGILAPGGWIAKTDPEGKTWEILSAGFRNAYDIAYDAEGELFAYDSDMEWDMGMPWYRPTRAVHATSGSEFGWRSGTGKWPTYYVDSLPPMVNVGPGSPVGVTFGHGAKFPVKYQKALFVCDWTFGTMYALHLTPDGSTYKAEKEEFLARTPLPLTDNAVGPDGALYFTVGGRGTDSELYRVTYVGTDSTDPVNRETSNFADMRQLRRSIEALHSRSKNQAEAVKMAYPYLGHADRFIRYAARVALEHQDVTLWQDKVLAERDPETLITGAVGLARQGDKSLEGKLLDALNRLDFASLTEIQKLELLRAWSLVFIRMGEPDSETAARLAKTLDAFYPAKTDALNRELCLMLVYLKSPRVVAKTIALMRQEGQSESGPEKELLARNPGYGGSIAQMLASKPDKQKIDYAFVLRNAKTGWTLDDRRFYFQWLADACQKWSGGASFKGFLTNIDNDAFDNASESERLAIEATGARQPYRAHDLPKPKGPGHTWTIAELLALSPTQQKGRDFKNGERTFAAARCVVCHRFGGEGGATGPDLTQAAGRFGIKDLAEAIVEPSKIVSDQYRASVVATDSGQVVTGRIVNDSGKSLIIVVDPEDSSKVAEIPKNQVDAVKPSTVSLMPENLLGPLNKDEVLDLLAYLLSRGNPGDPMFRK